MYKIRVKIAKIGWIEIIFVVDDQKKLKIRLEKG